MKKTIVIAVLFFGLIVSVGTVIASWSGWGIVSHIQYNRDSYKGGEVRVWLEGHRCGPSEEYFTIVQEVTPKEDIEAMVRLLTASKLSQQPVNLGFTKLPGKGTCDVYSVRF